MENEKISDEDLLAIQFFWEERGSVTRWCDWEKKLPLLRKQYPELVDAVGRYHLARNVLSATVKAIWKIRKLKNSE